MSTPDKQLERQTEQPDLLLLAQEDQHDGLTFEIIEEERTHEGGRIRSKGIYLFPNLITTAALLCGFYSIIASTGGQFEKAVYAIFLAALFDGLDVHLVSSLIRYQTCSPSALHLQF